jgi:hypothetical protein
MKRLRLLVTFALLFSGLGFSVRAAPSAPQATYQLVQSYIGPGGSSSVGIYTLSSSIGQPAAGEVRAGIYTLGSGFWGGGVIVPAIRLSLLYLPLVVK